MPPTNDTQTPGQGLEQDVREFTQILCAFNVQVGTLGRLGYLSPHKSAEAICMRLLNRLYGWSLVRADAPGKNEEAVDLVDQTNRIVVQVTATCSRDKINQTLGSERTSTYCNEGYRLKFAFVGYQHDANKVQGADSTAWKIRNPHGTGFFDRHADTLFTANLATTFEALNPADRREVLDLVRSDIGVVRFDEHSPSGEQILQEFASRLESQRKGHPSFQLMEGHFSENLLPKTGQIPNNVRRALDNKGDETSFREVIRRSWEGGQTHLLVTGQGGVGKTVALLTLATEPSFLPKGVPVVYIPLYDLAQYADERRDCIDAYLGSSVSEPAYRLFEGFSRRPWSDGPSVMLLLDGYNEIPSDARDGIDQGIRKWAERTGTQVITTSRIPGLSVAGSQSIELVKLRKQEARAYLKQCGAPLPDQKSAVWQLLETPLMLRLYASTGDGLHAAPPSYIALEQPDNAGHLVWNYLQCELARVIHGSTGGFHKILYAAAINLVLPYVCWRMESAHEFKIGSAKLDEYIGEACAYWRTRQKPPRFRTLERRVRGLLAKVDEFDLECTQRPILSEETCLLNPSGDGYTLPHQSLRDALAALHLRNVMEAPCDSLPQEFQTPVAEYVKDFLADVTDEQPLLDLWETNRRQSATRAKLSLPADTTATYNLLRVIHRRLEGDLRKLNWSGMDLRGLTLFPFRDGIRMQLSKDPSAFVDTQLCLECFRPQGHVRPITAIAFSPNGRYIATAAADQSVCIWDAESLSRVACHYVSKYGRISSVGFTPNSKLGLCFLAGRDDVVLQLEFDRAGIGNRVRLTSANDQSILGDGHSIGKSLTDEQRRKVQTITGHERFTLEIFGHKKPLVAFYEYNTIHIWNMESATPIGNFEIVRGKKPRTLCLSPKDDRIAIGLHDGSFQIWDVRTCALMAEVPRGATGWINDVCVSHDDTQAYVGLDDKTMRIIDLATGRQIGAPLLVHTGWLTSLDLHPSGTKIVTGSYDGTSSVSDLNTLSQVGPAMTGHNGAIRSVRYNLSGTIVATGSADKTVRLWDQTVPHNPPAILNGHLLTVRSVRFSPDGKHLASASDDGTICVWDIESQTHVGDPIKGHTKAVRSICFNSDGTVLASCSRDRTIRIWDVQDACNVRQMESIATKRPRCIAYSPDDRILACGLDNGDIELRDAGNHHDLIATLKGHLSNVTSLCFTQNGQHLISTSSDQTVRRWDISSRRCSDTIHLMFGIDLFGLDFSQARIGKCDSTVLYQNGAKVALGNPFTPKN